ncbi:TadE/TadG family type IV pilus assembly protein [Sphingomonas jatrophae]|uniref:TadE/TadG family type IV pilus assembly protein n=1 Tax=Sphingomonas jatrophae TaxID=1166337 RepID=UPI001F608E37|nr:TadE/TadG family type IV pilus assembly protein [Sphingomonas jatrophae]
MLTEFALVAPLLLMILLGIIAYGGYFWRGHALQQVANDAARASLAGLTASERASLARTTVRDGLSGQAGIAPDRATVEVSEASETITVRVGYDASSEAFFRLGLVPMPAALIRRSAAVRLGGL